MAELGSRGAVVVEGVAIGGIADASRDGVGHYVLRWDLTKSGSCARSSFQESCGSQPR